MIMMSFGSYRWFANKNPFNSSSTQINYTFAERDRFQDVSQLQFKGIKAQSKTFEMMIICHRDSDFYIIPELEKLGSDGKPKPLIVANDAGGEFKGLWVVTSISINSSEFNKDHQAIVQKATISLREFTE